MNASLPPSSIEDGLRFLPARARDASSGCNAARERHTFDSRVIDDAVGLIVRNQKIGIQTGGGTRLDQKFLEGNRALRHDTRVFHQYNVARHQVRTGDPGKLVVGKVPGLHTEDHADRAALHVAFAETRMQLHRRQEALGVLGIIGKDVRAEFNLAAASPIRLPISSVIVWANSSAFGMQNRRCLGHNDCPLGISLFRQV